MSIPKVYSAINAVAAELAHAGILKSQRNKEDQYQYRGIDDVYNRLSPLLATHKLCILPRVLERVSTDRNGTNGELLVNVSVKAAFDLVSVEDGSAHVIEAFGEALDSGDKATSKAMTAAYKYALFQTFCIPVSAAEDADSVSHKLSRNSHVPEPVQGWTQWAADVSDMLRICETHEAVDRVQNSNRQLLKAIARERADLYAALGEAIGSRREEISSSRTKTNKPAKRAPTAARKANGRKPAGDAHA